jgi:hypothetical protein
MAVSSTKKHNKINGLLFCRFPSSTFAIDTSHWVNAVAERGFQGRKTKRAGDALDWLHNPAGALDLCHRYLQLAE